MTRLLVAISLAAALITAASAGAAKDIGNPFIGHWTSGDAESCAPGYANDVLSIKIAERQIQLDEESCDIRSIRKISNLPASGYRLKLMCKAPSTRYASEMILAFARETPFHPEILVRLDLAAGVAFTYRRCPK